MVQTNEYERDLNDTSFLKHPGRIDLRVFQNTPDAGDGHPGVQRCFRNYLHEGGMEKDINLVGCGIVGTSVNINNAELQQLSNIGSAVIDSTHWGYVANMQSVATASSPVFIGLTLSADLVTTSTIDGVDVYNHAHSGAGQGGTISYNSLSNRGHSLSGGDHTASGLTIGHVIKATGATTFAWGQLAHSDLYLPGTNTHAQIDSHISTDVIKTAANVQAVSVGGNFTGTVGNISHGSTQRCTLTTSYLPLAGGTMAGNISMKNNKTIADLSAPVNSADAVRKQDLLKGVSSTTLRHSNDSSQNHVSSTPYKLKEIEANTDLASFTLTWEHRSSASYATRTQAYINGSPIGTYHENSTTGWVEMNETVTNIYKGDLIQIYGWYVSEPGIAAYVQNMRIKFDEFTNNL